MADIINPTIGRVVWYWPSQADLEQPANGAQFMCCLGTQPMAAMVTFVHSNELVNLIVHDHAGRSHPRTSVILAQNGGSVPGGRFCEWMPYQKGQAAKTEALESAVGDRHPALAAMTPIAPGTVVTPITPVTVGVIPIHAKP